MEAVMCEVVFTLLAVVLCPGVVQGAVTTPTTLGSVTVVL